MNSKRYSVKTKKIPSHITFAIDAPSPCIVSYESFTKLTLTGWVYAKDSRIEKIIASDGKQSEELAQNINRPDVLRVHPNAPVKCGFSSTISLGKNIKVAAIIKGETIWFAEIEFTHIDAIEGRNGYLFLDNDTNESKKQYTGHRKMENESLASWREYFKKLSEHMNKNNINYTFLLAPSKELIFPDYYPKHRLYTTPTDQLISATTPQNLIYPLDELINQRNLSYSKTDTHWTDYGASIVAKIVCDKFLVPFEGKDLPYRMVRTSGDLGRKLYPPVFEDIPTIDFSFLNKTIRFYNNIKNRGEIRVFQNNDAPEKGTCVIFGDSFSVRLTNFLALSFSRVVHIFSGADIDYSILEKENPKFVLIEITNRFIIRPPRADYSLKTDLSRKASTSSKAEISKIISESSKNNLEKFYSEITIEGLEN